MKKKRLISFLSAITIVATSSATGIVTVSADTEDYGVLPAIIDDTATPDVVDALAENYTVTANNNNEDGIIDVIVTADNLQKHTAGNDEGKGYWIGFAVKAPEGVDGIDYVFVDAEDKDNPSEYQLDAIKAELEQNIDGEGNDGIAFYVNAGAINPKYYAMLQWYAGDTTFGEPIEYKMDLTNVTLAEQLDITAADVKAAKLNGQPYSADTYSVTANDADGVIEVNINATDLKKHTNQNGTPGYWTGFALTAPEGATHFRYAFSADEVTEASLSGLEAVELDVDSDGNPGVAFYSDYLNPKTYVALQWFDEDGCRMSDIEYFTINLDNVDLDWINEDTVTPAIIADGEANYSNHSIATSQTDGVITVELHTKDLKKHSNSDGQEGYWTGFAIAAPEADAKATYSFGDTVVSVPSSIEEAVAYDEDGNPINGLAFYTDAGSVNAKTEVIVEWFDATGENSLAAETRFVVDLTNITLADQLDITAADVKAAKLNGQPYSADTYSVTANDADGVIEVNINATDLKKHTNQNGTPGYWTGFALTAPEGATHFRYAFSADEVTEASLSGLEAVELDVDSDGNPGVAFYSDYLNPKTYVALQWFDEDGCRMSDIEYFTINLDNVDLDWINEDTVTPAIIADGEANYSNHSIATSQTDGVITVELHTKDLKKHSNSDGQEGYWTGFAIAAPEADAKATYSFGDTVVSVPSSIEEAVAYDEDGNPINGLAFYTDAGNADAKTEVTVEWFDADGNSICAETTFVIDLTCVTLDGVEYITNAAKANIVNQDNIETLPYSYYSVTSQVGEDKTVTVHISMTNLKTHKAQNGETKYWTGFAVEAPEAGAKFKYAFADTKDALVLSNINSAETGAVINADGNPTDGVAFYTDYKNPKKFAALQWFTSTGEALTNVTYFEMNLDKVNLYKAPVIKSGGGGGVTTYTVTFNTNGGSNIPSARIQANGTVTEPTAPVKENYIFDGWFTDKDLTEKYDFSAKVVKSFTLYAKWVENKKDEDDKDFNFSDVSPNAWYYQDVKTIVEAGLMNGISKNEFSPESELTRAMFVTILYRVENEPEVNGNVIFTDVPEDAYYVNAVKWAVDNGIVTGVTTTEFAPDLSITREQMSTILYRYAKSKGEIITTDTVSYSDNDLISEYAKEAVAWAAAEKIMNGYADGSFSPLDTATRAQVAAVFVRYLGL